MRTEVRILPLSANKPIWFALFPALTSLRPPISAEVFVLHAAALISGILLTVLSAITLGSLLPDLRRAKLDLTSRLIILVWVLAFIVGIAWLFGRSLATRSFRITGLMAGISPDSFITPNRWK